MLETNGALLARAVQENPLAILITDPGANIVYANPAFCRLTGYSLEEIAGRNPRIFSSGTTPPETYRDLWKTILAGRVWRGDLLNRTKDGRAYWESISIAPMRDADGRVTHFLSIWNDSTERKQAEETAACTLREFERQSITDDLTGQYNRRHILFELEREFERVRRYGGRLSGMMIDIDDFKLINDRYGHPVGDRVLKAFTTVIRKSIRKVDVLGRYGGDEFLVLLPEATPEVAQKVALRIQRNVAEYAHIVLAELANLTASIGLLAFEPSEDAHPSAFIEKIDHALLGAKRAGKNTVTVG